MSTTAMLFFGIAIPACGLIVWAFVIFLKWLGNKPGDWGLIKDNWLIVLPSATMLIFAVMVAVLLYAYSVLFPGVM